MKLACLTENLNKAVNTSRRASRNRGTIPSFSHLLLTAEDGTLRITGQNGDFLITNTIPALVDIQGAVGLPASLFTEFIHTLTDERVELHLEEGKNAIEVTCGAQNARINIMSEDQFPPTPEIAATIPVRTRTTDLKKAIKRVGNASAKEESRPILCGIALEADGEDVTLAAADGFQLACQKIDLAEAMEQPVKVVIPNNIMEEIERVLSNDEEDSCAIGLSETRKQMVFNYRDITIIGSLLQGEYPNYQGLIPTGQATSIRFKTRDLDRILKTVAVFAKEDSSSIIRIVTTKGEEGTGPELMLSGASESAGEAKAQIALEDHQGEENKIAINSKYLDMAIQPGDCSELQMTMESSSMPAVFRMPEDEGYVRVVMPMFVQW